MTFLPIIIGLGVVLLVLVIAFRSRGQSRDGTSRNDAGDTAMIASPIIIDTSSSDDDLGDGDGPGDGGGADGGWSDGGGSDGGGGDGGGGGGD